MQTLKVLGQVDDLHRLSATVPESIGPGPVEILVIVPTLNEEDDHLAWFRGVAHEWEEELSDTRQDLYTLADGEPIDGSR